MMGEERKRSIAKMITTKIGEITISAAILQLIFGQPLVSLGLPFLLEVVQMGWYYLHERIWSKIAWATHQCESCHYRDYHEERRHRGFTHGIGGDIDERERI